MGKIRRNSSVADNHAFLTRLQAIKKMMLVEYTAINDINRINQMLSHLAYG